MRVFFRGFVIFLIFTLFSRWYFVCETRHLCGKELPQPQPTRPLTLSLKDGYRTILEGYEQFGFEPNAIEPTLTANNHLFLQKASDYLKQFPDKNITLTGRYLESEKNAKTGIFENLGIARAVAVERLLSKLGIDEKRISIDHQIIRGDVLKEPVSFSLFSPQKGQLEAYQKLEYKFTDNTFSDANFEYNSDVFRPGEQCIAYADSVKKFLDLNPQMTFSIIGHTDSIGTETYNYNLGLRRAKKAAEYFRELGVKTKINVSSKGESQPVAPNSNPDGTDNPEGRQKNRRVNFKIEAVVNSDS